MRAPAAASFGEAAAEAERVVAWLRLPAIALLALGIAVLVVVGAIRA